MKTTFLNGDEKLKERGLQSLKDRADDIAIFMNAEDYDNVPDLGSFYDYGLCFDYVELGTFNDQKEDYFRYQLSWGGPSDEIRFYDDGTIEYVFLDWNVGVGFDISNEQWANWLHNWFFDVGNLDFHHKRGEYDYYDELLKINQ